MRVRAPRDDGAIAITGLIAALLLLGLVAPVLTAGLDVLATHQRAQTAADAAALALIGGSPAAQLPAILAAAQPPQPTAGHDPDAPTAAPMRPPSSTPAADTMTPSTAALALARTVAEANGAVLVEVDIAGWPNAVLVTVHAPAATGIGQLWGGIEARAAAGLRRDGDG